MFKKLHINLTIFMGITLTMFMIFVANGIYYVTKIVYEDQVYRLMENEALKVQIHNMLPVSKEDAERNRYYFSLRNSIFIFGNQKLKSSYFSFDKNMNYVYSEDADLSLIQGFIGLVEKALIEKEDSIEQKNVNGETYRIYTKYIHNYGDAKIIQVYNEMGNELYFWSFLRTVLMLVGGIGIVILLGLSYLFTGKVLQPVKLNWQKQREFVADASHELRTPLTVIQTNLDVMKADEDGTIKENEMWLDNAYSETKVMADLIDQLLTLAKVDANEMKTEVLELSLSEIAESVVDNLTPIANNKNLKIEKDIKDDIIIKGDYDKIRRLIVILVDNAIKYTEKGYVKVSVYNDKKNKILEVEDTGLGIPKEDLPRVFDRFFRGDKARNRSLGGTGLGLSIAKWIVDCHKGKINVASEVGKGSKFTIEFN